MRSFTLLCLATLAIPFAAGCSSDPNNTSGSSSSASSASSSSSGAGGSGGGGMGGSGATCMPTTPIPCEDQVVQQMNLKKTVAPGAITDAADGNGFWSTIDATAGGSTPTQSYVYAKFTATGLQKVDLTDEASIGSMDWDIAFRRFIIRINSGNSGPSCVTAARMKSGTMYDAVTAAPTDVPFLADEYFSGACELIPDGSGLGSPATVMSGFWTYMNCVQMTDFVYVVEKADGSAVKLTITDYYEPTLQEQCDTMGSIPMGTPGGMVRMRWAFLP